MFYITTLCLTALLVANLCYCADPVLTPATLTDNVTNTADENSVITWATIPPGKTYKTDATYEDGGMAPLFDFSRSFINTAMPGGFPSSLVSDLLNGKFDIGADYMRILDSLVGYGACIVIGFLFIIIFTIVGCCFCCCRCCGNCGGKMQQKNTPSTACRRKVYGVVLLVLVIFTGVGCICVFVSNDRMSTSINKYSGTVENNLDDMLSFLDNTVDQVRYLLVTDLGFAFNVVDRDLNNVDVLVGIPVRDQLNTAIGAKTLFDSIGALQTDVSLAVTQFDAVKTDLTTFKTKLTTFSSDMTTWSTAYDADRTSCGGCGSFPAGTTLSTSINPGQIDISSSETEINKIRNEDMGALVQTARDEFNNIPERVKNDSKTPLNDISSAINTYKNDINPIVDSIADVQNTFTGNINLNDIKADVKKYTDDAKPYDKYRWYAGVGLTCIILLVVILQFVGLAFGVCGSSSDTLPTERGCLSHAGGNMLMASVGFIFIFSWLLMFLTTLSFAIGAPMERYLCQSLDDPELKSITEIMEDLGVMKTKSGTGSWLGETILGDSTIDLTIAGILKDCGDDKSAYTAFKLQYMKDFNLTKVTNYKQSIDIENQLNNINIDFSSVNIVPTSLVNNLNDFKATITNMNFAQYQTELNKDAAGSDLDSFLTTLQTNADTAGALKAALLDRHAELTTIKDGSYADTITAKNNLNTSMANLAGTFNGIPVKIDAMIAALNTAQNKLNTDGGKVVKTVLTSYMDRIFATVDTLIDRAVNGLKNDIAKCTPVYNLYQSVIVIGFCKYMIDAFNGFWFSLGWCIFFFVPSTVFAVKLAKHYRKMKFLDMYDATLPSKNGDPIHNGRNKVGHSDKF